MSRPASKNPLDPGAADIGPIGLRLTRPPPGASVWQPDPRKGSDVERAAGARGILVQVLVYTALALVPAKIPIPEILPEPPYAIVQPTDGPDPDLDALVASLAFPT